MCSLKVICWPRILVLCLPVHHQTCWSDSMKSLPGVHFVLWVCVRLHMCAASGKKRGMCSIPRATRGALFRIYLHYSCQSALLTAKWAKWIFCSGPNVIWKAGLCAEPVGGYTEMREQRWSSSSLHLFLSPRLTLLYPAAKTPTDKTLT